MMKNRTTALRFWRTALAVASLLLVTRVFAAGGSDARQRKLVEMPMRVQTEGMTYDEYRQRQAELGSRLAGTMPARSLGAPLRVELTTDEINGVERAPRVSGTPLQIGLVKAATPRVDITGLVTGSADGGPRRGPGTVATRTGDGGYVWALAVTSSSAGALRVHLENMSLPAGAELFFYSRIGEAFGPYTGSGPNADGDFWTDTVFGIEGILQLHVAGPVTPADLQRISLSVTEVGIVLPRFAGNISPAAPASFCGDPVCLVDASCFKPPAIPNAVDQAKDAIAKMEWAQGNFIYTCTGGLISDNNPNLDNLVLTANHCINKNNSAQNIQFYWRFRTSSCNGACPSNASWPYKTMGSTVTVTGKKGDFTLLHLNMTPPAGSTLLGWTTTPVANTNGAMLYRISNPDFGPQVYSQHNVDTVVGTCGGWPRGGWIYSRDITGAIDGGSSGSPIMSASAQVVGQLSGTCGGSPSDPCASGPGEANATVDGAFAFYYPSVQPFINP